MNLKLQQLRKDIQYKVVAVGESEEKLKEFYVCVDNLLYKVPTLIRAIDLALKICFVFNLEYTKKSKYVWCFLQQYIYKIPVAVKIPKIEAIVTKLNNVK